MPWTRPAGFGRRGCRQDGDQRRDLLGGRVASDELQRRRVCLELVAAHNGMFPCFFGGSVSRLVRSARRAFVTFIRVFDGVITVSM
jgi:hypothetical protein